MSYVIATWSDRTNTDALTIIDMIKGIQVPKSDQIQYITNILRSVLSETALNWLNNRASRGFELMAEFVLEYAILVFLVFTHQGKNSMVAKQKKRKVNATIRIPRTIEQV
eukprot:CAMPEP_0204857694 /NCGR_PEP_ID=MMETSP1347-20130617/21139_1 /ASSEMBLY_ACC=CAM_ASM_000690 /TAXON_ID=215587 /ORGANISM="Aplanochytrium stocchinoi, Strain GSBS06" /LENGTH=109 /DNA_ID=CAMNT_0052005259 /DNA_START=162 /DNA_END=487 /DNA_ORIENTATION=-